jgi:hypothetical protein
MAVSIRKDGTNYDAKAIEAIKEKLEGRLCDKNGHRKYY